ncbi:MAG: multifunctional oxoglutarate decarboxylase/oxoglutarate dehydrogenase thiamine pyrophosphate-binding subunit/dihydrolipoyllysine-residue succinyltransferase subunit [bacterium]
MSDPAGPDDASRFGPNAWLIEEKYRQFREFPESVGDSWRGFFDREGEAEGRRSATPAAPVPPPTAADSAAPAAASASGEASPAIAPAAAPGAVAIRGPAARLVENMEQSLSIPTATSVRDVAVRVLEENRRLANQDLAASGRKVSFTHLVAWALLEALRRHPAMTAAYAEIEGTPHRVLPDGVNLGIAVDVVRRDGTRGLLVPNIKRADRLSFRDFLAAYDATIAKARESRLTPDDFAGTTVTLTNPGMIGTAHSIPRLMAGQGLIFATGAIDYPAAFRSADPSALASLGVSRVMTVTSTYDHRVIQGAESGEFLRTFDALLQAEQGFYDGIFESLGVPLRPVRLVSDRSPAAERGEGLLEKEAQVLQLIRAYRVRGHLIARVNPLATDVPAHPELDPEHYGLTVWDLDREFFTGGLAGRSRMTLRDIVALLHEAYCRSIGVEYMHIQEPDQKAWIRDRVEGRTSRADWVDAKAKRRLLDRLNAADAFERFLHTKYVGHKRFSLEGAETMIPMLDVLFTRAADAGLSEAVIGMAHRGRLNVLANLVGMSLEKMFRTFEGDVDPESLEGSGDVKYHLGATGEHVGPSGERLALTLASNPSHLEAVDPVVEGMARAKQDRRGGVERANVLPVLIHGDAAFAGQGVVAETLNLSDLKGYRTGGTIHLVVNNGIGFTTAPVDARSTVYPTDVARMVQAPIFHVNGNDPEACVRVIDLAFAFRQRFKKDVVVDMQCYRKHGHNESDEPSFTQPLMYARIREMRPVRLLYTESLVRRGEIRGDEEEAALADFRRRLEEAFAVTHDSSPPTPILPREAPSDDARPSPETGVPRETLEAVLRAVSSHPATLHVHPKLQRVLDERARMLEHDSVDWATAEALAFGSILLEGTPVRLSGQDSRRGTFSQRHAVLIDQENQDEYTPLGHLGDGAARFQAVDSLLSEFAVLGFEYGYSVSADDALVLWEAQFGDFANGAQIVIDQFISSSEDKWGQSSRLVLLLPHGLEGQGPEHSSARLERFLTLCAKRNMRVAMPTTAAQYFHLLRRQVRQGPPKPLVVMTPKSLLRASAAKSAASEFTSGSFRLLMDDPASDPAAERILLCSGKVAHDLFAFRAQHAMPGVAIVRLEQLYPFPGDDLRALLARYPAARRVRWVQEEPLNMGAWTFVLERLRERLPEGYELTHTARPRSASPASGSHAVHVVEQELLLQEAFLA